MPTVCDEPQHIAPFSEYVDPLTFAGKTVVALCGAKFIAKGILLENQKLRFCKTCLTMARSRGMNV